MSIVALADDTKYKANHETARPDANTHRSSATPDVLEDIARRHNISIPSASDRAAYLTILQAADATASQVDALPDYISPLLAPVPTGSGGPRQYSRPDK